MINLSYVALTLDLDLPQRPSLSFNLLVLGLAWCGVSP